MKKSTRTTKAPVARSPHYCERCKRDHRLYANLPGSTALCGGQRFTFIVCNPKTH